MTDTTTPLAALIASLALAGIRPEDLNTVEDHTTLPGEDTSYAEVIAFADANADRIHTSLHDAISAVGFGPKTADRAEGLVIGNLVQKYLAENPESLEGFAQYLDGILSVAKLDSLLGGLSPQN